MGVLRMRSSLPECDTKRHCSEWARKDLKYCLCSAKDGVSLTLGLISVIGWGVAEIPQIITNYKQKSIEGLSIAFLMTWILGDLFNVFGCMLEPATLPTQFYMAMMYTITTSILALQTIYYGHIYHRMKSNKLYHKGPKPNQIDAAENNRQSNCDVGVKQMNADRCRNGSNLSEVVHVLSSPIPLPSFPQNSSHGRELYYMSARSLSRIHTPPVGSCLAQRMTSTSIHDQNPTEEPLLHGHVSTQSAPPSTTKTMLCLVSAMTFLSMLNFHRSANSRLDMIFDKANQGIVMEVGRTLLQVSGGLLQENVAEESSGIGTFLGWAMAAIYMGGRLPQICLNIRRGNVEGLNPLMFGFALVGNITYVASILVSSLDWSKIKPNVPWLVDAGGCALLDTFILIQFIYFRYRAPQGMKNKHGNSNAA